jgi:glycosidase
MTNEFNKVPWIAGTNVYEVNIRQYTQEGTFDAFKKHLTRLSDMGIEVLWLMPITPISKKNRKGSLGSYYASSSYTEVNPEFGTKSDFKSLVDHAHALGMKVVIDWVANHTGCDHSWTKEFPSFYKIDENGHFYDAHGWDDVIDLDYSNESMRVNMISSMQYWIDEFKIDGFRCDMAMLTPVDFWMQARKKIDEKEPHFWLAELDPADNPEYMMVFDAAYTWRWVNATKHFKEDGAQNIHHLRSILDYYNSILPINAYPAWFTSNHDENSWNGTEFEKYGEMAIPLAVFSIMWTGVPLIYSGQELPNLKRLLFFDKDTIEWNSTLELDAFYKRLLLFRKQCNVLDSTDQVSGIHFVNNNIDHHVLSFVRVKGDIEVLVIINFSIYQLNDIYVTEFNGKGLYKELFSDHHIDFSSSGYQFSLPPWGYQIWYK